MTFPTRYGSPHRRTTVSGPSDGKHINLPMVTASLREVTDNVRANGSTFFSPEVSPPGSEERAFVIALVRCMEAIAHRAVQHTGEGAA